MRLAKYERGGGGGGAWGPHIHYWMALLYYGVSTRHSRLAAEAPPSRQQGGVGECCKSPDPQKLSHFTLEIPLKISRLPCEYMNMYSHRKKWPVFKRAYIFLVLVNASMYLFKHFRKELVLQQDSTQLTSQLRRYARLNTGHFFGGGGWGIYRGGQYKYNFSRMYFKRNTRKL